MVLTRKNMFWRIDSWKKQHGCNFSQHGYTTWDLKLLFVVAHGLNNLWLGRRKKCQQAMMQIRKCKGYFFNKWFTTFGELSTQKNWVKKNMLGTITIQVLKNRLLRSSALIFQISWIANLTKLDLIFCFPIKSTWWPFLGKAIKQQKGRENKP